MWNGTGMHSRQGEEKGGGGEEGRKGGGEEARRSVCGGERGRGEKERWG